jgi:acetyltransferase-like isoleucine patch superfamily enzyme
MLVKKNKIPFAHIATIGILPSFAKKAIYRMRGHQIGRNVSIGFGSVIIGKQVRIADHVKVGIVTVVRAAEIQIARHVTIGSFTMIDTGRLIIGEDARINEQVIVGGMKSPDSSLTLGERTIIMEYSFVNTTRAVTIGDDSGIGGHCLLFTHGSWLNQLEGYPVTFAPITIGNSVWLPWRVFVMPGTRLNDHVVVGANSLLSGSYPSRTLVAGSPAKVIRENYPSTPDAAEVRRLFDSFVAEFAAFLASCELQVESDKTDPRITVRKDDGIHLLFVNSPRENNKKASQSVYVFNLTGDEPWQQARLKPNVMILDVARKLRWGKSDIGEEFTRFLSRYGLRFKRAD